MVLWQSQMEDHTSDWLCVVPISRLGQTMNGSLLEIFMETKLYHVPSLKKVDIGLDGGRDKPLRPADMLLYSWDRGLDVCLDFTGLSLLTQTGLTDFVPGRAVSDAAHRKLVKYEAKCADIGYDFLPFSFSLFGELENDVVTLLKRILKFYVAQNIGARAAIHIFSRISFVIAK
ncbi:hypothetical protein Tco_0904232, partial [Tanacetum coccineum]